MRAFKTVNDSYIEPISFTVPRRAETFQSDIFPPAVGIKPAMSAQEWLSGKTAVPPKIDLESVYDGNAPVEVACDSKPAAVKPVPSPTTPAPARKPTPPKEPESRPAVSRAPPSVNDQKTSISAMANKFQDEPDEEEVETSSFEEIAPPPQRAAAHARADLPAPSPAKWTAPAPIKQYPPTATPAIRANHANSITASVSPATAVGGTEASTDIMQMLRQQAELIKAQTELLNRQNDQLAKLTNEVELIRERVGSNEYIRKLELELEAAKS
jgi:coronin-1B/1C/6